MSGRVKMCIRPCVYGGLLGTAKGTSTLNLTMEIARRLWTRIFLSRLGPNVSTRGALTSAIFETCPRLIRKIDESIAANVELQHVVDTSLCDAERVHRLDADDFVELLSCLADIKLHLVDLVPWYVVYAWTFWIG